MHSLTCMSVVVCVMRKPRPCNSYSRRRDRINSVLWRSYYKRGGGTNGREKHTSALVLGHPLLYVFFCELHMSVSVVLLIHWFWMQGVQATLPSHVHALVAAHGIR